MDCFELNISTKIYFGENIVEDALKKETAKLGKKVLIVSTGRSLRRLGYLDKLENTIQAIVGTNNVFVYENISANPDVDEIQKAVETGKQNSVTTVVGFGGGSAIDAAKATAVGIVSDNTVEEFLLRDLEIPENTLPIIAIPTTAGTGSELSRGAIVSSRKHNVKSGIRGEKVLPQVAIVDPVYTWSSPMNVTMEAGFDVFAHAAESYCSKKATLFSKMLSENAMTIVGEYLPKLAKNLDDHEARRQMAYASMLMGFNLKDVGNCLPHRMQYPVGVLTDTSHGAGLLALYPSWLSSEFTVNKDAVNSILACLNLKHAETQHEVKAIFCEFLNSLNVKKTLTELGIQDSANTLKDMVTGNIASDKLSEIDGIIEKIYTESM